MSLPRTSCTRLLFWLAPSHDAFALTCPLIRGIWFPAQTAAFMTSNNLARPVSSSCLWVALVRARKSEIRLCSFGFDSCTKPLRRYVSKSVQIGRRWPAHCFIIFSAHLSWSHRSNIASANSVSSSCSLVSEVAVLA